MIPKMKKTWRWYGPEDPVSLDYIKQTGAKGIVTALHHIPNGQVWSVNEINKRKNEIENNGLKWDVVESLPVHEDIKTMEGDYSKLMENYKQSMTNLSLCGINTICYNFMPVLDWTRTNLNLKNNDNSFSLEYNFDAIRAFDLYILKRKEAFLEYSKNQIQKAKKYFDQLSQLQRSELTENILSGLPGSEETYSIDLFKKKIKKYKNIDSNKFKDNLINFLNLIIPHAKLNDIMMCIHPDDPPFSIFSLPRVVSDEKDLNCIFEEIPDINNGLTFCTGSLGVSKKNDLNLIFNKFAKRIHFIHLRNIISDFEGNFRESNHLEGDVNMFEIVKKIINEQISRVSQNKSNKCIPMRPDHGNKILDDIGKLNINPGYSAIGRLKALAEIRGLELGIVNSIKNEA